MHPSIAEARSARAVPLDHALLRGTLRALILVAERFPREYDIMYCALLDMLHTFEREDNLAGFSEVWSTLADDIFTTPQWLDLLFPEEVAADPTWIPRARALQYGRHPPVQATSAPPPRGTGSAGNAATDASNALLHRFLHDLSTVDPRRGPPFLFLSRFYFFRDILYGYFVDVGLKPVQRAIFHLCYLQRHNWRQSYAADYPYQGLERLGISGIKPTEERLARYDVAEYLEPVHRLLDVGSNNGLWSLGIAAEVRHVDALEFNPYLVAIANLAKEHLRIANVSFIPGDFVDFETPEKYDVVCSLANHCTIDGNLSMDFEQYIAKIFSFLRPGGILLFESHNVFGPGAGGAGDDGDLDAKFDIAERYFSVVKHRMSPAYVPAFDIDKLFVVMRRREHYDPSARRTLVLSEAKQRYGY